MHSDFQFAALSQSLAAYLWPHAPPPRPCPCCPTVLFPCHPGYLLLPHACHLRDFSISLRVSLYRFHVLFPILPTPSGCFFPPHSTWTLRGKLLEIGQGNIHGEKSADRLHPLNIFRQLEKAEWDTLLFFYGVVMCVGALGLIGYLDSISQVAYQVCLNRCTDDTSRGVDYLFTLSSVVRISPSALRGPQRRLPSLLLSRSSSPSPLPNVSS